MPCPARRRCAGRAPTTQRPKRLNPIRLRQMQERCEEIEEEVARLEAEIADIERELADFKSVEETMRLTQLLARPAEGP